MATIFTRVMSGELPGRFVWADDTVMAFLSINPIAQGHTLVVPRVEVDHWLDLDAATWQHVAEVSRRVGLAIQRAFSPARVGQMVAGFEVPHVHVHVLPINDLGDLNFAHAAANPDPGEMDDSRERIVTALNDLGDGAWVPQ